MMRPSSSSSSSSSSSFLLRNHHIIISSSSTNNVVNSLEAGVRYQQIHRPPSSPPQTTTTTTTTSLGSSSSPINEELRLRMENLKSSERIEQILSPCSSSSSSSSSSLDYNDKYIQLPVICFDALLPNQHLVGRTQDPTFSRFLQSIGLGGFFVMTSLQPKERKIRRHGVVCKIVAVDARQQQQQQGENSNSSNNKDAIQDLWDTIPTAVDFKIVGHSVCRITDPESFNESITKDNDHGNPPNKISGMKQRIGRWRRMYDPNGEESCLGWGDERFVDLPAELIPSKSLTTKKALNGQVEPAKKSLPSTEWSSCWVEIRLEPVYANGCNDDCENTMINIQEQINDLQRLVGKWYDLASDPSTYENVDVTASSRISKGHPGLYVDPKKLLDRVNRQLGQQPGMNGKNVEENNDGKGSSSSRNAFEKSGDVDPTPFLYWVAALINPLPPLGVSPEIRGAILEAPTIQQKIEILKVGLDRSIQNLKGSRPL